MRAQLLALLSLFALGLIGVVSLWPTLDGAIAAVRATGGPLPMSEPALRLLLLIQPTVLMGIGAVVGLLVAHRVGLRSILVERVRGAASSFSIDLRLGALGGLAAGLIITLGDLAFASIDPTAFDRLRVSSNDYLEALLVGILYGGLTEEIMMRWGLMSLLAWVLVGIRVRRASAMFTAAMLAALAFALAHLPALALAGDPSSVVVARTILLNTAAGIIFGVLFWRRNLETAMVAHATAHVVLYAGRVSGLAL